MKRTFTLLYIAMLTMTTAWATDGETFTVNIEDGVYMTFRIISESDKTCELESGESSSSAVISAKKEVAVPNSVNGYTVIAIGDYAFYDCDGLTSVTIPESVTSIGNSAFEYCSGLTSVTIPNSVTTIGKYAFCFCENLVAVYLPDNIATIDEFAFGYCTSLSTINIPNPLTSLRAGLFRNCKSLTSIYIPANIKFIPWDAFDGCENLSDITVDINNKFFDSRDGCNAIVTSVPNTLIIGGKKTMIPESVSEIGGGCFFKRNISSITIPSNIQRIGANAFERCDSLEKIIVKHVSPIEISPWIFSKETYQKATLYVPTKRASYYKNAAGWGEFVNIEEIDMDDVFINDSPFINIEENQMILGYYTSDDIENAGYGGRNEGIYKVCVGYSPEKIKPFVGNKVTHVRFALVNTDISFAKVWIGSARDAAPLYTQEVSDLQTGWNEIQLEQAFEIKGDSLFLGLEYLQDKPNYPISCISGNPEDGSCYFYGPYGDNDNYIWLDQGGAMCLSFQCIIEGNNIPQYDIHTTGLSIYKNYFPTHYCQIGDKPYGHIYLKNWGKKRINSYEILCQVDGKDVHTQTEGSLGGSSIIWKNIDFNVENLSVGLHTLTVSVKSINGESPLYTDDDSQSLTFKFCVTDLGRQKIYLECQTATWCPHTMSTLYFLKDLAKERDDIAFVLLHDDGLWCEAGGKYGVFYPRVPTINYNHFAPIGSTELQRSSLDNAKAMPSLANVNIEADYHAASRTLKIKVKGERHKDFVACEGWTNLTVLLTEDDVVYPQYDGDNDKMIYDYQHQAVLRTNVSSVWGDPITWDGDTYEKEYSVRLDEGWEKDNMKIVAYLAKPFTGSNYDEICVVNCNDFAVKDATTVDIEAIEEAASDMFDVYSLSGIKVKQNATSLEGLSRGVYIVNGKKVVVKK
ncbi:MAG: leucine-rich repeat protein [Bacteroidaceae bacterium]|nr:leucine-rich repeat protein [Bacteroidaceae bacterium]